MKILCFALLFAPLIWELIDDRRGDLKKALDVAIRYLIAGAAAVVGWWLIGKPIIDGVILSISIHFFFFDYAITWALIAGGIIEPRHGGNWWNHIPNTALHDKNKFWKSLHPWTKFSIRLLVLLLASFIYFVEYKF